MVKTLRRAGLIVGLFLTIAAALAGCSRITAQIESYSPAQPVQAAVGETIPLKLTVVNTGNRSTQFLLRALVWDQQGQNVGKYETWVSLKPNERTTQTWNHTVSGEGTFTLQFQVWKDQTTQLAVMPKDPQALVIGVPAATTTASTGKFKIGDKVRTLVSLKVRTAPGVNNPEVNHVNYRGSIPPWIEGQVVDGPKSADGYTWWRVKFITGVEGWCAEGRAGENWLEKVSG
jgi:hypothetical protein